MPEYPSLPEQYVKRIISDMLPDDVYYLKSETLTVDRQTLQPYFSKYTPVSTYERSPSRLIGRYGIMRVLTHMPEHTIDGYIIDMRFVDPEEIEQTDFSFSPDDSFETVQDIENDRKDLLSPLGIIAINSEDGREDLIGDTSIHQQLLHLCTISDGIHERIVSRSSAKKKKSNKSKASAKLPLTYTQSQE